MLLTLKQNGRFPEVKFQKILKLNNALVEFLNNNSSFGINSSTREETHYSKFVDSTLADGRTIGLQTKSTMQMFSRSYIAASQKALNSENILELSILEISGTNQYAEWAIK